MNVRDAFAQDARVYDASRRKLVPCFDEHYGAALALSGAPSDAALRILDLAPAPA